MIIEYGSNFILSVLQGTDRLLETEHALVMLLLLYWLLTFNREPMTRWVPVVVAAGLLLSTLTPSHEIDLFWPVITAMVVPPLMWQAALAVARSGPIRRGLSLVIWLAVVIFVTMSLTIISQLPLSFALVMGILTVTLVWYFREFAIERSFLSTLGLITLAVLLLEIDLALVSLRSWIANLLSGVAVGFATGFVGLHVFRRLNRPTFTGFFLIWAYVAYFIGLAFGVTAIAPSMAAALVVAAYGYSTNLWREQADIPTPAHSPFFFLLASGMWILLGWQAHTEPQGSDFLGTAVALLAITAAILIVRKWVPLKVQDPWRRLVRKEVRVFLLLLGAILYWPQQAELTTLSVEVALVGAIVLIFFLRVTIPPLFDLLGIELSWPSIEMD